MGKILTAAQVKRLPVGTKIKLVREGNNTSGRLWVVKSGNKKMLCGVMATHKIEDRPGWHFEEADDERPDD